MPDRSKGRGQTKSGPLVLQEGGEAKVKQGNKHGKKKRERQGDYNSKRKEVKQNVKRDKKKWTEDLAQQAEEAATAHNIWELYNLTKRMAGKNTCNTRPMRDKDGKLLSKGDEQMSR